MRRLKRLKVLNVSELRYCDALLVSLYYVLKLLCHYLHLVGFHFSFKCQIKHQYFLVPTKMETTRVGDCNWTRTHNHLVHKRTLNQLAKLASLAKWLSVRL